MNVGNAEYQNAEQHHDFDNIIDEKIDLEKIVEVKMQIEELHKALLERFMLIEFLMETKQ